MRFNCAGAILVLAVWLGLMVLSPDAKIVQYTFTVSYFSGSPDGVFKDKILGINGRFPGPTIFADVNDTLEIHVRNQIQDGQNTSLHWHGMHQAGSFFEDGTTHVSQCPLKVGESQVYSFQVRQAGTYWYHSHVHSQYTEGLWGSLIVYKTPEPEFYFYHDEILITLSDWYHRSSAENEAWLLSPLSHGVPPYPDAGMINGLGRYPCDYAALQNMDCDPAIQRRPVIHVHPNKIYRVRLINTAAVAAHNFTIDGHPFSVIETDGNDVFPPVLADMVIVTPGQRYSFLIHTGTEGGVTDFLIRGSVRTDALMLSDEGPNITPYPEALMADVSAVLRYVDDSQPAPVYETEPFSYLDTVPPPTNPSPLLLNESRLHPLDGLHAPSIVDQEIVLDVGFYPDDQNIVRGSFNKTPFVYPDKPLAMMLIEGDPLPEDLFYIDINHMDVIQIVINNPFPKPHPFHIHGHHFWVLGTGLTGDDNYNPGRDADNLMLDGARRDTVVVQERSWAVIRFVADNPGCWTFHCHNDWHNLEGMIVVFIEGRDINQTVIPEEAKRVCKAHLID